jgi:hypothetical protein
MWASGGKELVYVGTAASSQFASVSVTSASTVNFGTPTLITPAITDRVSTERRNFDVLPDGRFIGLVTPDRGEGTAAASVAEIRVILNFFEELKARVPVK